MRGRPHLFLTLNQSQTCMRLLDALMHGCLRSCVGASAHAWLPLACCAGQAQGEERQAVGGAQRSATRPPGQAAAKVSAPSQFLLFPSLIIIFSEPLGRVY